MFYTGIADEAGTPISEQIRAHKLLGWKHVEVRNVEGGNLAEVDDATFEKTLAAVTDAGMQISCFASGIANWARNVDGDFSKDVSDLKRAIPRMKKAGCRFIRIMSWPNAKEKPLAEPDWKKEVIRRLKELTKMAEDGRIVLVHENCSGWAGHSPETVKQVLAEIKSPAFAWVYDTGNPVGEGQDPWTMYQASKSRTVYVHIKDGKSAADKHEYTYPGEGEGRVRDVVADLLKSGYDGGFSMEPHMASQVHLGTKAEGTKNAFDIYVEFGRRFMKLVDEIKGGGKSCGCGCGCRK